MRSVVLLEQDREIEAGRTTAEDSNAHEGTISARVSFAPLVL
ncbi:hypothetical protein DB32_005281 [Sandaracinus amylolyticus]|uniref:Uncharacterized protein n=1 Tax=Sandaracinus amylolyticus TaxID=927083 RepID=A0A0F6YJR8_9BACT|nr:hypothetical protein DB32_005281 [Sandaracinus amylolyticus]